MRKLPGFLSKQWLQKSTLLNRGAWKRINRSPSKFRAIPSLYDGENRKVTFIFKCRLTILRHRDIPGHIGINYKKRIYPWLGWEGG